MYIADACVSAGRFAFSGLGKGWCRLAFMVMSSALQISRGPCSLISLLAFLVQYFVVSTVALELENHFWIQFQIQKQHEDFASYPRGQGRARLPYHEGMCHWFGLWDSETFSGTTSHQHVTGYEHVPPGTAGNNTCPISHWFWFTKNNRCFDPARPKNGFVFRGQQHLQDHRCHSQNRAKVKRSTKHMPWRWYQAGRLVQLTADPECFCRRKDWTFQHDSSQNLSANTNI